MGRLLRCCLAAVAFLLTAGMLGAGMTLRQDPEAVDAAGKKKSFTYGLRVSSPWDGGGEFLLNLPEHLMFGNGAHSILHWNHSAPNAWTVAEDKKSATMRVESPRTKGLWVVGEVQVKGENTLELSMKLENRTTRVIADVDSLFCVHHRLLKGFPSYNQGFDQTHVPVGGKLLKLSELATRNPKAEVKFANIEGSGAQRKSDFAEKFGGMSASNLDFPLTVVTDKEGKRKLVMQWLPGGVMLSNSQNPCIHCDPIFEKVPVGETRGVKGIIELTEEPLEGIYERYRKRAAGGATTEAAATEPSKN